MGTSYDIEYLQEIAKKILRFSPVGASKIVFKAEINLEGDVASFEYDYEDQDGSSGWFTPDSALTQEEIFSLLKEHRTLFVSKGQNLWLECMLSIDVSSGKISMALKYD
ncbi:hypothetical protein [Novosphingobium sp. PhB57]|uniref:hypothetical protein n=1 Tax=Novosphingobium sp. PhB57 TaxID=2485107 RepID=UPI00104D3855|nr:hypothetical protein [Novosphingobium sp. PhB57]